MCVVKNGVCLAGFHVMSHVPEYMYCVCMSMSFSRYIKLLERKSVLKNKKVDEPFEILSE